jgi:hypothetical protein
VRVEERGDISAMHVERIAFAIKIVVDVTEL